MAGEIDGWRYAVGHDLGRRIQPGGFATDGQALAWKEGAVFAVEAKVLVRGGKSLFESSEPATFELLPDRITGCLAAPAKIVLFAASRPASVTVNGKALQIV